MPEKRIADRRIYGRDRHGREVLVAAPGQPIPAGFDDEPQPEESKPKRRSSRRKKDEEPKSDQAEEE